MKLLLDENLSRRLIPFLQHDYPGSSQVVLLGFEAASDSVVWHTAKDHGFVIVIAGGTGLRRCRWMRGRAGGCGSINLAVRHKNQQTMTSGYAATTRSTSMGWLEEVQYPCGSLQVGIKKSRQLLGCLSTIRS